MKKIICISGTNRPDNYTIRAIRIVVDELKRRNTEPILFDGRELKLSFPGYPETEDVQKIQNAIKSAQGVVLATPEYHGSFSAFTKLIIENLGYPSVLAGKPVAILGVASGRIGAIKAIEHLKSVCTHIGAIVVPTAISIAGVRKLFDAEGNCKDPETEQLLRSLAHALLDFLKKHVWPQYVLEEIVRKEEIPWSSSV